MFCGGYAHKTLLRHGMNLHECNYPGIKPSEIDFEKTHYRFTPAQWRNYCYMASRVLLSEFETLLKFHHTDTYFTLYDNVIQAILGLLGDLQNPHAIEQYLYEDAQKRWKAAYHLLDQHRRLPLKDKSHIDALTEVTGTVRFAKYM